MLIKYYTQMVTSPLEARPEGGINNSTFRNPSRTDRSAPGTNGSVHYGAELLFIPEATKQHLITAIRRTAIEAAFAARNFAPTREGQRLEDKEKRRRVELADNMAGAVLRYGYQTSPEAIHVVAGEGLKDDIDPIVGVFGGDSDVQRVTLSGVNDPVDNTEALANGWPRAIAVQAITSEGGFDPLPKGVTHMLKLIGPRGTEAMDLDADIEDNLRIIAQAFGVPVSKIVLLGLDRPGVNDELERRALAYGARIENFKAGDVIPSILVVNQPGPEEYEGGEIYFIGGQRGGAEEGLISAAGALVRGAHMQVRFRSKDPQVNEQYEKQKLNLRDLISGDPNRTFISWAAITDDDRWFPQMRGVELYPAYGRSPEVSSAVLDVNGLQITRTNTPRIIIPQMLSHKILQAYVR